MNSSPNVFDAYSRYYDLLYQDKDYAGEVEYIDGLLPRHGIEGTEILELGSGTGRHGVLLAGKGYSVHGIERSPEMIAMAAKGTGFTCQQEDICIVRTGRIYDAVVALFHVMSYQISNDNVQSVFNTASHHLKKGGLFLFDFWYSPAVYAQRPAVRVKHMANDVIDITRIAEPVLYPNENRVDVHYKMYIRELESGAVQTITETHPMRHFSLPEIDFLAASTGFVRISAEEFLTGKPPGEDTWGVCVVLRKIS